MKVLVQAMAVGVGGFVGALARWGIVLLFRPLNPHFPAATFLINITGSFFLGLFLTFVDSRYPDADTMKLAVATGFVGAYTTFSTFMYESAQLADQGATLDAVMNLLGSLLVGLLAVKLGMTLGQKI